MDRVVIWNRLKDMACALRTQLAAGLSIPLADDEAPSLNRRARRPTDLCDDTPGRHCRNGYGSLEVGGLRDRDVG